MELKAFELGEEKLIPLEDEASNWHRQLVSGLAHFGRTLTAVHEGRPVAIMGMIKLWDGVADTWSLIHPSSGVPARQLVRLVRGTLDDFAELEGLRRCNAIAVSEAHIKWMRLLGYEHEFTMVHAAPDGRDLLGMVKWYRRH